MLWKKILFGRCAISFSELYTFWGDYKSKTSRCSKIFERGFWNFQGLNFHCFQKIDLIHVDCILTGTFKIVRPDGIITETKYFNTKGSDIFQTTDLKERFDTHVQDRSQRDIEEFEERDSQWSLRSISNLIVFMKKLQPMHGGSSYIKLPI